MVIVVVIIAFVAIIGVIVVLFVAVAVIVAMDNVRRNYGCGCSNVVAHLLSSLLSCSLLRISSL